MTTTTIVQTDQEMPPTLTHGGHVWVLVTEAARRLGLTTGRIYHLTSEGRLPTLRAGRRGYLYVREDGVQAYARYRQQLATLRDTRQPLPGP